MRVLRIQQVNGDGSSAADTVFTYHPDIDPASGTPFLGDDGQPAIELRLRSVSREQYRDFVKAHSTPVANGTGVMEERTDWDAVNDDVVCAAVVDWRGFVGADNQPLTCIDATKRVLDTILKNAIRARAMFAQPAEVAAASFRQSADVPAVVGRLGEGDAVLSTGDAGRADVGGAPV